MTKSLNEAGYGYFLSLFTLVIWCGVLLVGGLGMVMGYPRPAVPHKTAEIQAEFLNVRLTEEALPQADSPAPQMPAVKMTIPSLPALQSPQVSAVLATPLEMPSLASFASINPTASASSSDAASQTQAEASPVKNLVWDRGAGKQAAPSYPHRSVVEGQQGSVQVRFGVGTDGQVSTAEVTGPSPWPLLNDSALHTIQKRWHFPPGPTRLYQVTISFKLEN